jgi:hypothetical protein
MKEIPERRITVTSSLNEIFTDQLGNREVVWVEALLPPPIYTASLLDRYLKTM